MAYRIELAASAKKTLDRLPKEIQQRFAAAIDRLAETPTPSGVTKMTGGTDLYRIRVGDYWIIYHVGDERLLMLVVRIGHRREVYR